MRQGQHAICYSAPQRVVVYRAQGSVVQCAAACCSLLQCVAVNCSAMQRSAACCSVLQCVVVCCGEGASQAHATSTEGLVRQNSSLCIFKVGFFFLRCNHIFLYSCVSSSPAHARLQVRWFSHMWYDSLIDQMTHTCIVCIYLYICKYTYTHVCIYIPV